MLTIDDCVNFVNILKDIVDSKWLQKEFEKIQNYFNTPKNIRVLGSIEDSLNPLAYLIYQAEKAIQNFKFDTTIGITQEIAKATTLGMYVASLRKSKVIGFNEKISEMKKSDKDSFEKIVFELNIASSFIRSNHKVEFIKTDSIAHKKTPDLLVDENIEVECKKKDRLTPRDRKNNNSWNTLHRKLIELMNKAKKYYLVYIYFETDPNSKGIQLILRKIRKLINSNSEGELNFGGSRIIIYKICDFAENFNLSVKIQSKEQLSEKLTPGIFNEIIKSRIPDPDLIDYKKQQPDFDSINQRVSLLGDGNAVTGEIMKFIFKTKEAPDRLKSIIKSLNNAKNQFSGTQCNIVCVNVTNISNKFEEKEYIRLGEMIRGFFKNNTTVSSVAITSEIFNKDKHGIRFQHQASVIRNENAKFPLPENFVIMNE